MAKYTCIKTCTYRDPSGGTPFVESGASVDVPDTHDMPAHFEPADDAARKARALKTKKSKKPEQGAQSEQGGQDDVLN